MLLNIGGVCFCLIVHSVNVGGTYDEPAAILTIWIEVVTGLVSPWLQEASHVEGTMSLWFPFCSTERISLG